MAYEHKFLPSLDAMKWVRFRQDEKDIAELQILDQLLLPHTKSYIKIESVQDAWNAIKTMKVRGAPAIAIVGCLSLSQMLINELHKPLEDKAALYQYVENNFKYLLTARPTAINLKTAVDQITSMARKDVDNKNVTLSEMKKKIIDKIESIYTNDRRDNRAIGANGFAAILTDPRMRSVNQRLLTHCNTGSLATAGYGTALGIVRYFHEEGKLEHVYFTETRPYNQGARLTAYELLEEKIPSTLICDNMVAMLMTDKKITTVVVGADRIAINGDTANKIGTYQIAILANYHKIPFIVAAPSSTIDVNIQTGDDIVIEERPEKEMVYVNDQRIAPEGVRCWNPAFDVTPADLITRIVTERGSYRPSELKKVFQVVDRRNP
ncbi:methylthioribose-1-phosphate isomerase [Pseudomyrmex gracilis]|uniref:methylthioribose-1-phosphate isomerase n=1 Tax=Pseudomyrmex gracilis TaxID=219809 RepID=UPI000994F55A|nr:methylthioribose-1-phosphate isomerase [Pseudomyrmex gracilis]